MQYNYDEQWKDTNSCFQVDRHVAWRRGQSLWDWVGLTLGCKPIRPLLITRRGPSPSNCPSCCWRAADKYRGGGEEKAHWKGLISAFCFLFFKWASHALGSWSESWPHCEVLKEFANDGRRPCTNETVHFEEAVEDYFGAKTGHLWHCCSHDSSTPVAWMVNIARCGKFWQETASCLLGGEHCWTYLPTVGDCQL